MQFDIYGGGRLGPYKEMFAMQNWRDPVMTGGDAATQATAWASFSPIPNATSLNNIDPLTINAGTYVFYTDDSHNPGGGDFVASAGLGQLAYLLANGASTTTDPRLAAPDAWAGAYLRAWSHQHRSPGKGRGSAYVDSALDLAKYKDLEALPNVVAGAAEFVTSLLYGTPTTKSCTGNGLDAGAATSLVQAFSSCWADLALNGAISDTSAQSLASQLCTLAASDAKNQYQPGNLFGYPTVSVGGTYFDAIGRAQVDLAVANGYGSYTGPAWDDLSDMAAVYSFLLHSNPAVITNAVSSAGWAVQPSAQVPQSNGATPEDTFVYMSATPGTPVDASLANDRYLCTPASQGFFFNAGMLVFALRLAAYGYVQNGQVYNNAATLFEPIDCSKASTPAAVAYCCANYSPGSNENPRLNIATGCSNSVSCASGDYVCMAQQGIPPPNNTCPPNTGCCQAYYDVNPNATPPLGCSTCATASCCQTTLGWPTPVWSDSILGCGQDAQTLYTARCPDPTNNGWPCDECYGLTGTALQTCCASSPDGLGALGPTCIAFAQDPCNAKYGPSSTCCDANPHTPTCKTPENNELIFFAGAVVAAIVLYTFL